MLTVRRFVGRWWWVPLAVVVAWCAVAAGESRRPLPGVSDPVVAGCVRDAYAAGWNGTYSEVVAECGEMGGPGIPGHLPRVGG